MNNEQIIMHEAIASGYFTEEEIQNLIKAGKEIPFHTYAGWKRKGMIPRAGCHGWQTKLWKRRSGQYNDVEGNNGFFLTKSFLFHESQCEPIKF